MQEPTYFTVKELIEQLQQLDPDALVLNWNDEYGRYPMTQIKEIDEFMWMGNGGGGMSRAKIIRTEPNLGHKDYPPFAYYKAVCLQ
jgi:hypothetical protein